MKAIVAVALFLTLIFSTKVADAQNKTRVQAPLGLQWGWTQKDLVRNGVRILSSKPAKKRRLGRILRISNPPKRLRDGDVIIATMTNRYGLQKVVWASKNYRRGRNGSRGKARYSELKSAITRKYGPPKSYEWISKSKKYDRQRNYFYRCMRTKGCGNWASYWTTNFVGTVSLKIRGLASGNGYIKLGYEGPNFSRYFGGQNRPQGSEELRSTKDRLRSARSEGRRLESERRKLVNKLLDAHVRQITSLYSDATSAKLRRNCFKIYDLNTKLLRVNRKIHGKRGHLRDFYTFVQLQVRKRKLPKKSKQCGFWFTEQLGKIQNALKYALADFAAYHNVNVKDDHSARMLGLIYETGRGGRRNKARAQYWYKKAKARGAKVDHLITKK